MKTPIETIRKAAAARGGLAKATDDQLRRWWSTLDNITRDNLTSKSRPAQTEKKTAARPAAENRKDTRDADPTESQ